MNKIVFMILFAMVPFLGINAQDAASVSGSPESTYPMLKSKLKRSNEGVNDPKKSADPKFWLSRAELLMDIFNLHRQYLQKGAQQMTVTLLYQTPKDQKKWTDAEGNQWEEMNYETVKILIKNGVVESFEEFEVLHENPLPEALSALEKAQSLDTEGKLSKKIKEAYITLKLRYQMLGVEKFYIPDFPASFNAFSAIDKINQKPLMEGAVDTTFLYYAGMAALRGDMDQEAIEYFEKTIQNNYPEPDAYVFLKLKYLETCDTLKALDILEKGFKRFPSNEMILRELINYYLFANKAEEAMNYLKLAQAEDPSNLSYILAEGTLYDKMGEMEKAKELYQKTIDMDPTFFDAYFNMGVIFYNKAYAMYKEAEKIKNPKEYGVLVDSADAVLAQALPFMEKAHELKPEDRSTLETLKTLYYRMQINDKYEEVKLKLEALPSEAVKPGEIQ